jgi:hypothetical protein
MAIHIRRREFIAMLGGEAAWPSRRRCVFDRGRSPGTETASAEISRPVRLAGTRLAAGTISP